MYPVEDWITMAWFVFGDYVDDVEQLDVLNALVLASQSYLK